MQIEGAKPRLNCLNEIGIKTLEQISSSEKYRIVTCIAFIEFLSSFPLSLPSTVEILVRFSFRVITLKFMKSLCISLILLENPQLHLLQPHHR